MNNNNYGYEDPPPKALYDPSIKDWIITFVILSIPCVGLIMTFIWAFGENEHGYRVNFSKSILAFVGLVFAFFCF